VKTSGNPWDDTPTSGNDSNANDTTAVIPGYTSTTNGQLIVLIQGTSNNATATTNCGAVTNADLASLTERFDSSNTLGLGSGHCIITGEKATAGSIASSTLTMSATTFKAAFAIGLASPAAGDCTVTTDIGSYTACVGYDSGDATVTVTTSGATLLIAMNSNESSDAVTTAQTRPRPALASHKSGGRIRLARSALRASCSTIRPARAGLRA
jgi:hypothetical protein